MQRLHSFFFIDQIRIIVVLVIIGNVGYSNWLNKKIIYLIKYLEQYKLLIHKLYATYIFV